MELTWWTILLVVAATILILWILVRKYVAYRFETFDSALESFFLQDCATVLSTITNEWPAVGEPDWGTADGFHVDIARYALFNAAMSSALVCSSKFVPPLGTDQSTMTLFTDPRSGNVMGYGIRAASGSSAPTQIVWRGTETNYDAYVDVNIEQVTSTVPGIAPPTKLHAGFNGLYTRLADQVAQYIESGEHVFVYGHSMGGALAQLSTIHLRSLGVEAFAYAFAPPKISNSDALPSGDRIIRIVNTADIVPTLPVAVGSAPYYSVGDVTVEARVDTGTTGGNHTYNAYWNVLSKKY